MGKNLIEKSTKISFYKEKNMQTASMTVDGAIVQLCDKLLLKEEDKHKLDGSILRFARLEFGQNVYIMYTVMTEEVREQIINYYAQE